MITGEQVADNIRAERNRAKFTQEDIAIKIGVSTKTYIEYEKNADLLTIEKLIKLAKIFNCSIDSFYLTK